jgi:hypothetical protein
LWPASTFHLTFTNSYIRRYVMSVIGGNGYQVIHFYVYTAWLSSCSRSGNNSNSIRLGLPGVGRNSGFLLPFDKAGSSTQEYGTSSSFPYYVSSD